MHHRCVRDGPCCRHAWAIIFSTSCVYVWHSPSPLECLQRLDESAMSNAEVSGCQTNTSGVLAHWWTSGVGVDTRMSHAPCWKEHSELNFQCSKAHRHPTIFWPFHQQTSLPHLLHLRSQPVLFHRVSEPHLLLRTAQKMAHNTRASSNAPIKSAITCYHTCQPHC